ncbi:SLAC1 anion channel family protein [Primorskyibacter sp. 2E233]|uniref:SLAC1 anion channel family protein n=1 Tax=Primorskyibacter sp. 2E233 TaxID=3413431 RepID=UPI003BF1294E
MTDATLHQTEPRLAHFPVTFFATVMGLAGLTLALHLAETRFGWGHRASNLALWVTIVDFAALAVLYGIKALRHPGAIAGEWNHPVKLAFFPAISISLMLIATALRAEFGQAAVVVWSIGAAAQAVLFLAVLSGWIGRRPFQPMHISPAWFIPAVGNVVAPVAGVPLGFIELSWLFFATGLIFWIVLLTLVMNRLIFHDPLPGRLYPTLVILIAPPAVGFLAWLQLNGGQLDAFARILYYGSIAFAGIVAMQVPSLARLPFALSWWALSFPVAALTIATLRYGALAGSAGHDMLGGALLALLLAIVVGLIGRTMLAATRGEICQPE